MPVETATSETRTPVEDTRLDRLLEYTKFHIGIYLAVGGGLVTLIGSASKADEKDFLSNFIGSHGALAFALLLMAVAGLSGGIIASCCTQHHTFERVWCERQGPHKLRWFTGQTWAFIEHFSFWLSMVAFAYAVLSAPRVVKWLFAQ